jgi:two-component system chemotaxis response regulator CheB
MEKEKIKVLIVDDSPVAQNLLKYIIESDPDLKVVGTAKNGDEVFEILQHTRPDVITMDIVMPRMNGFEVTRRLLQKWSLPVIIVSEYYNRRDVDKCFRALEAGALAILEKPKGIKDPLHLAMACSFVETIKAMAHVKLPQWSKNFPKESPTELEKLKEKQSVTELFPKGEKLPKKVEAIAIGASIGGPAALAIILKDINHRFPVPIFLVQHISGGFISGFVDWLSRNSALHIQLAIDGDNPKPGVAYIAPDQCHLEITSEHKIRLVKSKPENGHCPSIGHLFKSIVDIYGDKSVSVLLSGMGTDGVQELLYVKEKGGFTIAQDEATSVMFGKVREAIQVGAVKTVLPIQKIAPALEYLTENEAQKEK